MLMTKELEKDLPALNTQENEEDPICMVKYFNPVGRGYWFGIEYDPSQRLFFGYVSLFGDYNDELGYFSLDELESIHGIGGLGIERDLSFEPTKLSEIKEKYTK
jgi:hypothetical protein